MTWGGGGAGALAAMSPALARCRRAESLWKKWLITLEAPREEREEVCFAMAWRWWTASESQPPRVSTTSGTKFTPLVWHARKCLFILEAFIDSIAALASLEARGRAVWLRGEVTATSKAGWRPCQLGKWFGKKSKNTFGFLRPAELFGFPFFSWSVWES